MKKILLVHEATYLLDLEQTILRRQDYDIHTASDGYDALRIARETHPDLVIIDDALSGPTAREICRKLRNDPRTSNCSIMVTVNRSSRGSLDELLQAGANDYVVKPVNRLLFNQRATSLLNVPTRRFLRTLVKMEVDAIQEGESFFGSTVNLSESGLMLETRRKIDVGKRVCIQFFLPGESAPILAAAEVVRMTESGTGGDGFGLCFLDLAAEDRDRIRTFVERIEGGEDPEAVAADAPSDGASGWEPPAPHLTAS